eukprot:4967259-Lingulodinium_polyedra.AAC.1
MVAWRAGPGPAPWPWWTRRGTARPTATKTPRRRPARALNSGSRTQLNKLPDRVRFRTPGSGATPWRLR